MTAPAPQDADAVRAWFAEQLGQADTGSLREALLQTWADAYAYGGLNAVPGGAVPSAVGSGVQSWDEWQAGNKGAADLLADGGWKTMLDNADLTVQSIADTSVNRVGSLLAQGAAAGLGVDEIANNIKGYLDNPDRAGMIASTELARATELASMDAYKANGVTQWDWILSPSACPICEDLAANNPHSMSESPPPAHPGCRCASAPLDVGASAAQAAVDTSPEGQMAAALGVERMDPQGYDEAYKDANPGTGTPYRYNCHFCVESMEMRARGFDVVAQPTYKTTGRYDVSIAKDWVQKDGRPAGFVGMADGVTLEKIEKTFAGWPPGARGFIAGDWKNGGGHIFNFYKDENGKLHLIDGQVARKDASSYLARMKNVRVMRIDDKEPVVDRLKTSMGKEAPKATAAVQRKQAENLLNQLFADYGDYAGNSALRNAWYEWTAILEKAVPGWSPPGLATT